MYLCIIALCISYFLRNLHIDHPYLVMYVCLWLSLSFFFFLFSHMLQTSGITWTMKKKWLTNSIASCNMTRVIGIKPILSLSKDQPLGTCPDQPSIEDNLEGTSWTQNHLVKGAIIFLPLYCLFLTLLHSNLPLFLFCSSAPFLIFLN